MNIRDRVKELRRVPASQLKPSPKNWRLHPKEQADALRGLLAEVGFAGAALARELEDGSLELIDGHLRVETTGDMSIPVLVLDVTAEEADKLLATFDPISAMATADAAKLDALLKEVSSSNEAVNALLESVAHDAGIAIAVGEPQSAGQETIPEKYQILIEFENESSQAEWLEKLTGEGLTCRSLIS
jgi:ParB-like nuclease domain